MKAFNDETVQQVWEQKGRVIPGQDAGIWRKDECGAWVRRDHYGNRHSEFGWEIAHIHPAGPTEIANLRVLQWENHLAGGTDHLICCVTAEHDGIKNKRVRQAHVRPSSGG